MLRFFEKAGSRRGRQEGWERDRKRRIDVLSSLNKHASNQERVRARLNPEFALVSFPSFFVSQRHHFSFFLR
jgi:hypothetical protein